MKYNICTLKKRNKGHRLNNKKYLISCSFRLIKQIREQCEKKQMMSKIFLRKTEQKCAKRINFLQLIERQKQ